MLGYNYSMPGYNYSMPGYNQTIFSLLHNFDSASLCNQMLRLWMIGRYIKYSNGILICDLSEMTRNLVTLKMEEIYCRTGQESFLRWSKFFNKNLFKKFEVSVLSHFKNIPFDKFLDWQASPAEWKIPTVHIYNSLEIDLIIDQFKLFEEHLVRINEIFDEYSNIFNSMEVMDFFDIVSISRSCILIDEEDDFGDLKLFFDRKIFRTLKRTKSIIDIVKKEIAYRDFIITVYAGEVDNLMHIHHPFIIVKNICIDKEIKMRNIIYSGEKYEYVNIISILNKWIDLFKIEIFNRNFQEKNEINERIILNYQSHSQIGYIDMQAKRLFNSPCDICFEIDKKCIMCNYKHIKICIDCLMEYIKITGLISKVDNTYIKCWHANCGLQNINDLIKLFNEPLLEISVLRRRLEFEKTQSVLIMNTLIKEETEKILKDSQLNIHTNYCINEFLTLKCPHCKLVFTDFTGCIAVECTTRDSHQGSNFGCGKYFCGLCFFPTQTSSEVHSHATNCHAGYYFPVDRIYKIQLDYKSKNVNKYLLTLSPDMKNLVRDKLLVHEPFLKIELLT
jgi:hypothetical protein